MRVTVDASVAVKWPVAEDHRPKARSLLGPRIERYAPDLLPVECASAIWKKARRGEIGAAAPFLDEIAKLSGVVRMQPGDTLLREATETALRIGQPVYDSLYVACARRTGSILVTADRKLARIVSDRVAGVDAIALQDDQAMAGVEAAAIRLVIDRDKVTELVEAWERVAATTKSVADDIRPAPGRGLRVITPAAWELAEASPTYLKLQNEIKALSLDERMDLLLLGWVGDGRQYSRRRLFDLAMRSASDIRYIAGLGMHWHEGLRRWSTWDRDRHLRGPSQRCVLRGEAGRGLPRLLGSGGAQADRAGQRGNAR